MVERTEKINSIVNEFDFPGTVVDIAPFKSGHINETFISTWETPHGGRAQFIHQWINHHVFRDVPGLMGNIHKVTSHLQKKIKPDSVERTLEIIPTKSGALFFKDSENEFWRSYRYIENSESFGVCRGLTQAEDAARILGKFQSDLTDMPTDSLVDTIPFFHHTPKRYEAFEKVIAADKRRRVAKISADIQFALSRKSVGCVLIDGLSTGSLPRRVTHNDMKLNNVLFDERSGEGICLVDLDTVMAGTPLFDYGDLVRNVSVPAAEDETDLTKVEMQLDYFEALTRGYARCMATSLNQDEIDLLVIAPRIMALTLGMRFLTDYIDGDHYFKVHRPDHNLVRARTQFKIVQSMERQESAMRDIVNASFSSRRKSGNGVE